VGTRDRDIDIVDATRYEVHGFRSGTSLFIPGDALREFDPWSLWLAPASL
jgi:hypothetical protein